MASTNSLSPARWTEDGCKIFFFALSPSLVAFLVLALVIFSNLGFHCVAMRVVVVVPDLLSGKRDARL